MNSRQGLVKDKSTNSKGNMNDNGWMAMALLFKQSKQNTDLKKESHSIVILFYLIFPFGTISKFALLDQKRQKLWQKEKHLFSSLNFHAVKMSQFDEPSAKHCPLPLMHTCKQAWNHLALHPKLQTPKLVVCSWTDHHIYSWWAQRTMLLVKWAFTHGGGPTGRTLGHIDWETDGRKAAQEAVKEGRVKMKKRRKVRRDCMTLSTQDDPCNLSSQSLKDY